MIKAIIVDDERNCCETMVSLPDRYCPAVGKSSIRKKIFYLIVVLSALQCACERTQKQTNSLDSSAPKAVEAKGYIVPKGSMAEPKVISAGKPKIVPVGNPKSVLVNSSIRPAGKPKVVMAGVPRLCAESSKRRASSPASIWAASSLPGRIDC